MLQKNISKPLEYKKDTDNLVFCFHQWSNADAWETWSSSESLLPFNLCQLREFLKQSWFLGTEHSFADFPYVSLSNHHTNACKPSAYKKEFLRSVIISFILNLDSVSSVSHLFVLIVDGAVNDQSLCTLSCHSLVHIPRAFLLSVWGIPVCLILPSSEVVQYLWQACCHFLNISSSSRSFKMQEPEQHAVFRSGKLFSIVFSVLFLTISNVLYSY